MAKYHVPVYAKFLVKTVEIEASNPVEALKAAAQQKPTPEQLASAFKGTSDFEISRGRADKQA